MQITIDTAQPLSPADREVLAVLIGRTAQTTSTVVTEPEKKPAAKPASKPKPKPEPEPEPTIVEEPEPEVEEPEVEEPADEYTLDDAISAATRLVSTGKADKVRSVLKGIGGGKVSNLSEEQVQKFMVAVQPILDEQEEGE